MNGTKVIPYNLDALVGKEVSLALFGEYAIGSFQGKLDAVVGDANYILRTKRDDVTIRFSVGEVTSISIRKNIPSLVSVRVNQQPKLKG